MLQKYHQIVKREEKSKVVSSVGYIFNHRFLRYFLGTRVLSATDLRQDFGPRTFDFTYDLQRRMTREVWTHPDGSLGQVLFIQYSPDGSVVATRYYPDEGQLRLYESGVEISISKPKSQSKVYKVRKGDFEATLDYTVARRLDLPELFGNKVIKQDAFTLFEAAPWLKDNPRIDEYSEVHPWLKEGVVVTDFEDLLKVSIPTHRPLEDIAGSVGGKKNGI